MVSPDATPTPTPTPEPSITLPPVPDAVLDSVISLAPDQFQFIAVALIIIVFSLGFLVVERL